MSFVHNNSASAIKINDKNGNILHNSLFSPQTPKLQTEKFDNSAKNVAFPNFNIYDVLTPQPYNAVNNLNKREELLIDLSDDDSQNKNENRAQNGNDVKDFFATTNQEYRIEPNLIDLFENILATPQLIHKSAISKPNLTRSTDFGNLTDNIENNRTEDTSEETKSFSFLDELLNSDVEPKIDVIAFDKGHASSVLNTNVVIQLPDEERSLKDLKINQASHSIVQTSFIGEKSQIFDKIDNEFERNNYSLNIDFHNYNDEAETSYEDIDDIIDEVLNRNSFVARHTDDKYNQRMQAASTSQNDINQRIDAPNKESYSKDNVNALSKLKFNDDTETETSSIDIDDLINDIFNLKAVGITKIDIAYPKLTDIKTGVTRSCEIQDKDSPRSSHSSSSVNNAKPSTHNAEFYSKNVFDPQNTSSVSKYNKPSRKIKTPEDTAAKVNQTNTRLDGKISTKGADIYEKSIVLPQMLARIAESKRVKMENNLKKQLILDPGNVDYNQVQMLQTKSKVGGKDRKKRDKSQKEVNFNPVVLMEDSRKVRLDALEKSKLFSEFVKGK